MMTTKNILVGIGAAILLVLPTFVNIASAGTEASVSEQQVLTEPYAGIAAMLMTRWHLIICWKSVALIAETVA